LKTKDEPISTAFFDARPYDREFFNAIDAARISVKRKKPAAASKKI
jgi:hypothetical protein